MTCPDRPHDLDLLLAGEPADAAAETHAAECPTCSAEVALAARIDAALGARREVTAPPAVVAAALAEARRQRPLAPARAAVPSPQVRGFDRLRLAGVAALAVLIAFGSWAALRTSERPTTPEVADAIETPLAPEAADEPSPDLAPTNTAESPLAEAEPAPRAAPEPEPQPAPSPAPRRAAPRSAPRSAPTPSPETRAPAPEAALDTATPPPIAEAEPTPADIERAEAELKLAFALIADAQRQAGRAVRAEAGPLSTTIDHTIPFSP